MKMGKLLRNSKILDSYYAIVERLKPGRIFWVCFVLLLSIHCIENTSVIYLDTEWLKGMYLFRNLLYLVLLAKIGFLSVYTKRELICVAAFLTIGLLSFLGSGDYGLLEFFILMFAAKEESSVKLTVVFFLIKGAALIITIFLWRIGILAALYYQDDKIGYYNTYGFCHRNVLAANVAVVCLAWLYLRYRRLKIWDVAVWGIVALATYRFAVSRTGLIIILLSIFGIYFFRKKNISILNFPYLRKVFCWGFLGLILISVIGTVFYSGDSPLWSLIDSIFTKRFQFAHYCFEEYGLSLFGQHIPLVSSIAAQNDQGTRLILDNAYMRGILYYGVIPGTLFLTAYFKALDMALRKRSGKLIFCLGIFAIYGLSERYMLDVYYQFPLLVAWCKYFFKERRSMKEERKLPLGHMSDFVGKLSGATE